MKGFCLPCLYCCHWYWKFSGCRMGWICAQCKRKQPDYWWKLYKMPKKEKV